MTPPTSITSRKSEIQSFLNKPEVLESVKLALPEHLDVKRLSRLVLSSAMSNPKLLECSNQSLALAMMTCSEIGLEPNGRDAHLVPFGKEIVVVPDYRGLIKLAYQSGMVLSCMARAVYEKDHLEFKYGTKSFLDYTPSNEENRGELSHAWAMVELREGGSPFIVLNKAEVLSHKPRTAGRDSPWNTYPAPMWAKTAFKVLSKFIPLTPHLTAAVKHDNEIEASFSRGTVKKVTPSELMDLRGSEGHSEADDAEIVVEDTDATIKGRIASAKTVQDLMAINETYMRDDVQDWCDRRADEIRGKGGRSGG